ncbi:sensor histidine kinase [Saccharibacillus sp. CPCC 101409]|uniref:sensor histidine kinase n=1 Tax=Saccharibacillus sp. CPCC 101409 TaxID=3058041 RepID=UPI00267130B4|nr:sensor histidine kinase [Saccharibacillus sp. CPCC 101409]MDO3409655.1 sensor histidine kinase [Saccharibacillus sp. CPCC 101409]
MQPTAVTAGSRGKTRGRFSLFAKMNSLIAILFLPIVLAYTYSNDATFHVVSRELQTSSARQLTFLSGQIDSRISQMMDFSLAFSRDPNVQDFNGLNLWGDRYDRMQTRYAVREKMVLQSGVSDIWPARYALYSQQNREVISNYAHSGEYDEGYLKRNMTGQWNYDDGRSEDAANGGASSFHWLYADSLGLPGVLTGSSAVVEASFSTDNIRNMLDTYKADGQGDPFYYRKDELPILNRSADRELTDELIGELDARPLERTAQRVVALRGQDYLVSSAASSYLDGQLIDFVPLGQVLGPIAFSRNLFYLSIALLFVLGISASILLYRNVQRPIRKLMDGLLRVQSGDYSVRLHARSRNEFSFVFDSFNEMSRRIQELIENVFNEKLRAREATLKQLQAQINPHFLYNCLGYIINMAQMKDEEAVVSMAFNLSAYYRYTTRMEKEIAPLKEEVKLLVNYLGIQKLRNGRIDYRIELPEPLLEAEIPRLMLQPVVENAVIHGVAKTYTAGEIRITGEAENGFCLIRIDDDGPGMTPEQYAALNLKMTEELREEMGCGLWNTHQRIVHQFGTRSGLRFGPSPAGGFRTEIFWESPENTQNEQAVEEETYLEMRALRH